MKKQVFIGSSDGNSIRWTGVMFHRRGSYFQFSGCRQVVIIIVFFFVGVLAVVF